MPTFPSFFLLFAPMLLAADSAGPIVDPSVSHLRWFITETDQGPTKPDARKRLPWIQVSPDGAVSGFGGCNGLGGMAELAAGKARFQTLSTMMACPDMETEQAVHSSLSRADGYRIEDGKLFLTAGESVVATLEQMEDFTTLHNTRWKAVMVRGSSVPATEEDVYLMLRKSEEGFQVEGFAGVNRYFGTATVADHEIRFEGIGLTRMAGPHLEFESGFLKQLGSVDRYRIDGEILLLFEGELQAMIFDALYLQ